MFLGLLLLIVPWFSYRQLIGMEALLIQGQSNTQLLTAEGISTLFNGRDELFSDLPISTADYEALYAHRIDPSARLDGSLADWGDGMEDRLIRFGADRRNGVQDGTIDLVLGEKEDQLYGFVRVVDDFRVYRDARSLRLDRADHLRISYIQNDGEDGRLTLALPGEARHDEVLPVHCPDDSSALLGHDFTALEQRLRGLARVKDA